MKKLLVLTVGVCCTIGCAAVSELEDAADALEEAEKQLDKLDISGCIAVCEDLAEDCLDEVNTFCVDNCEYDKKTCDVTEDNCYDGQKAFCEDLYGPEYTDCIENAKDHCYLGCNDVASNCYQGCSEQAQQCLVGGEGENFSSCMSSCIEALENELQNIDL